MAAFMAMRAVRSRSIPSSPANHALRSSFLARFISTLVVAEHEGGLVKQSSLSAVAAAAQLGGEKSISVLLGGSGATLHKAASHAATCHPLISQVLVADADKFVHPMAETWAELIRLVQQRSYYSHIIATSSSFGKNVLPRAAALLDVQPVTDVIDISEPHLFVRPIYAGNALCTVRYMGSDPCIMTIRSTSFTASSSSTGAESEVAPISPVDLSSFDEDSLPKSSWLNLTSQETERPDLGNARIVVTGGRGLKSAENFKLLEKLAEKLGAAVEVWRQVRWTASDISTNAALWQLMRSTNSSDGAEWRGNWMVMMATMWAIWLQRNQSLFHGERCYIENIVEHIRFLLREWANV